MAATLWQSQAFHESGRRYEWDNQAGVSRDPEWLLKALREPSETLSGRAGTSSNSTRPANLDGRSIPSGRRNETRFRMGWIGVPSYRTAKFGALSHHVCGTSRSIVGTRQI